MVRHIEALQAHNTLCAIDCCKRGNLQWRQCRGKVATLSREARLHACRRNLRQGRRQMVTPLAGAALPVARLSSPARFGSTARASVAGRGFCDRGVGAAIGRYRCGRTRVGTAHLHAAYRLFLALELAVESTIAREKAVRHPRLASGVALLRSGRRRQRGEPEARKKRDDGSPHLPHAGERTAPRRES